MKAKPIILIIIIAAIFAFIWFCSEETNNTHKSNNWITIDYSNLINKSTITHSGETVGEVINKIPQYTDNLKGLVQQYLEPYSILCHDALLASTKPDTLPLVNILTHYPEGSEQPAWAELFREGHYQLYYNTHKIRIFLKGDKAKDSFDRYQSVIRYPIKDLIESKNTSIATVEVYVFKNDYAKTKIRLNTIPEIINVSQLDLSPKRKSIDLASIEEFLSKGVILEAIEVDNNNDLYLYGRIANHQTIAGHTLSLSDIAIIYRSIFHYGNNAPYISLDKHEDNRFAKVNLGGHLENTRPGSVVLEADKLFKTLGSGLDPNTHKVIIEKITRKVPGFLTEDERNILENVDEGRTQIRYWFYPDSIGTVTNGSIGAILTHQFLADIERMDAPLSPGLAVRKTINHLNKHYDQYEKAEETYQELSTIGRIMALINWLKGMNINERIELDEFLSVELPAYKTPDKTKKMFAITTATYPHNSDPYSDSRVGTSVLNPKNIRRYTKVFYISDLLNKYSPRTSDKYFLEVGREYYSNLDMNELAPPEYIELKNYLDAIEQRIKQKEKTLNRYSQWDVNNYNKLVEKQNAIVKQLNNMHFQTNCIVSIGGGIDLNPGKFKGISYNKSASKLRELSKLKSKLKNIGDISRYGNWIRSNPGISKTPVNKIPSNKWSLSKSENINSKYTYKSITGNRLSLIKNKSGAWISKTSIEGIIDVVKYDNDSKQLFVNHSIFSMECRGDISPDGKRIVFNR